MTINHIGFDHPPVGLIEIFQEFDVQDRTIWILEPFTGQELPYDQLNSQDLVVIYTHEAAGHVWFDRLLPMLHNRSDVPWNNIAIYSGCLWDPDSPVTVVPNIIDAVTDFLSKFSTSKQTWAGSTTHHFVCLNRSTRWQRTSLVTKILDLGLGRFGHISHPQILGDSRFPLVLDKPNPSLDDGFDVDFPELLNSAINVITESSYEPRLEAPEYECHPRPGIGEKTFKTWMLGQFPIWLSSYRTVACVRDLGFDVFDDLIDHSYDLELDPQLRIDLVAKEIKRICQHDLEYWVDSKNKLKDRLQKNLDRLWYFNGNHRSSLLVWQKWFNQIC